MIVESGLLIALCAAAVLILRNPESLFLTFVFVLRSSVLVRLSIRDPEARQRYQEKYEAQLFRNNVALHGQRESTARQDAAAQYPLFPELPGRVVNAARFFKGVPPAGRGNDE